MAMAMPKNRQIWTWFDGEWQEGNVPIMGSADHGTWLGTMVFDGARWFDGVCPDLDKHCARLNHSAVALGLKPSMPTSDIIRLCEEGCGKFLGQVPLYIRPMAWSTEGGDLAVDADPDSTTFAICIEEATMASADRGITMTTTRFRRPTLDCATVDAKAACLYPNNARMLKEAQSKGFTTALTLDALGNVAETATANIWMVKDGEYFTPIPNGTFLNGVTRQRLLKLLEAEGEKVHETVLTEEDFHNADEIFVSGNYNKVTPVVKFESRDLPHGKKAKLARKLYWEWAGVREG
jgi:branched-chain amino acid aminotransferase